LHALLDALLGILIAIRNKNVENQIIEQFILALTHEGKW
jgi:hypothetical protein